MDDALWRTLIGNCAGEHGSRVTPAPEAYGQYYRAWLKLREMEEAPCNSVEDLTRKLENFDMTSEDLLELTQQENMFLEAMASVMLQRGLCVTSQGYLGAVSQLARVGTNSLCLKVEQCRLSYETLLVRRTRVALNLSESVTCMA